MISRRFFIITALLTAAGCFGLRPAAADMTEQDAVVKIFVTANRMDFYRPWQAEGARASTGSGVVIEGPYILTNAHVVSDHTFIQVRKESDPRKFTAKVKAMGHDCDLALLIVDDPTFFDDVNPVSLGEMPSLKDAVTVIGFPTGGDKLSITEGVVSRIEVIPYSQSMKNLLSVQIDAAINPGNSGGPVLKDGELVGVAMQVIGNRQNIGYMIPPPIIRHFLSDLDDGSYDGFPSLGVEFHNTENPALREFYKSQNFDGGVLVTRVLPFSSAEGYIEEGDILLSIDNIPVGVDGTFPFRGNERMALNYLITRKQMGESLAVQLSRSGRKVTVEVPLREFTSLVPEPHHYDLPPYYIYGGLVFTVLSADLLKSWGQSWWEKAPLDFLQYLVGREHLNPERKQEIVVLLAVLPDDINVGYHGYNNKVISRVNGQEFDSFRTFVTFLENLQDPYVVFETDQRLKLVVSSRNIRETTEDIIRRNHVLRRYSPTVAEWLTKP